MLFDKKNAAEGVNDLNDMYILFKRIHTIP